MMTLVRDCLMIWLCLAAPCVAHAAPGENPAHPIVLHYFWADNCPHCAEAKPFLEELQRRFPEVQVRSYDLWNRREDFELLRRLAEQRGQAGIATPAILLGEELWFGFDDTIAAAIEVTLARCRLQGCPDPLAPTTAPLAPTRRLTIPGVGSVPPETVSLPLLTLVLGLLDSFNPCAFFVLLFLLSLLVHAHSRRRMLTVGLLFVVCSGLVYFLFMTAWLNLFLWIGALRPVTLGAGLVALVLGLLNIKDFFRLHQGPSASIPEQAKPGLFARMRGLVGHSSWAAMLGGTVLLALTANSYELLCTAGFPMVYTRVLTLHRLELWQYYAYLGFYNLVYILPLLLIVVIVTITLGSHKLSEGQGRVLKLLSGTMMLLLGGALLWRPALLNQPLTAAGLPAAALVLTALIILASRLRRKTPS